ncbi:MAG: hypothetical protein KGO52_16945, partial [Nitrospirota bacterium]|nr:hypothetical protein [Nitrospirota bacterium]
MRVCWGNTPIRLLCTSLVSLALGAGIVWEQAALAAGEQITVVQEESLGAGAKAVVEDIGALLT